MMRLAERLEIRFTSQPATVTSAIIVDGKEIARGTFRDQPHLSTWTSTLEDIAEATWNLQKATSNPHQGEISHATAASKPERQTLEYRDDQSTRDTASPTSSTSSYGAETTTLVADQSPVILLAATSRCQSALTRLLAETGSVEPTNMTSAQWSTAMENDRPLATRLMLPFKRTDIGDANTLMYKDGVLFDTSSTSPSSDPSGSVQEAGGIFFGSISSRTSVATGEQTPGLKRRKKLDLLLERIRDQTSPDQAEHNEKVDNLCNSTISFTFTAPTTVEQFGHLLSDLGHVSNVLGFMYGLLSWEVFRREEGRLIQEEGQSARWAAKRMNDEMSKQSDRHATTKDWASDGRRAAGMVFGSIAELSAASKSLAVFLLADLAILDNLIKIAHFPVLRERFAIVFREIHESRERENNLAEGTSYKVFDFEAFLSTHGRSINLGSLDPMAWQSPTSLIHPQDLILSEIGHANLDTIDKSPRKRRRISQLSTAGGAKAMWSTYVDTSNNGSDQRIDTVPAVANLLAVATDENECRDRSLFTSADETQSGRIVDSPQTEDYNILFEPSPNFDASFQG